MKTISIFLILLSVTPSMAGHAHVSVQVAVQGERNPGEPKNPKTHDENRSQWLVVRVTNQTPAKLEGLTLKWALYADELRRGSDRVVLQKSGELNFGVDASGRYTDVTTPKVAYEWTPQHGERTGSGRRARGKNVDETGRRYHGYTVEVIQNGVVIGEASSHRSLQKAE